MDKFGHEPLHYPDEVQPDKHRRDRDPKVKKPKRAHSTKGEVPAESERRRT